MVTVRFLNTVTGSTKVLTRTFESEGAYLQWLQAVRPMVELLSVSAAVAS